MQMHVLADEKPLDNIPVMEQFAGMGLDYELCRCSMVCSPFTDAKIHVIGLIQHSLHFVTQPYFISVFRSYTSQ